MRRGGCIFLKCYVVGPEPWNPGQPGPPAHQASPSDPSGPETDESERIPFAARARLPGCLGENPTIEARSSGINSILTPRRLGPACLTASPRPFSVTPSVQ